MKMLGIKDTPIKEVSSDMLGIGDYINGLSKFILGCDTPMTIAIQGDWGTGKTSFMNMVKQKIDSDVMSVWFNTWQFSQFNMDDNLSITLLNSLLDALDAEGDGTKKIKQNLGKVGKLALGVADSIIGTNVKDSLDDMSKSSLNNIIMSLKDDFQDSVNRTLYNNDKKRMVIYIDDLDRLNPEKAVEVLEILKIFLDCHNCVFVLAIDYYVVSRGISKKYGDDFSSDKGKSFFDKIIQVPFKIPTAHYQIQGYIEKCLDEINLNKENSAIFTKLLSTSLGYNPRGMKRILNAFLLLTLIHENKNLENNYMQKVLFAVLCLQLSFEEAYNNMVLDEDDNLDEQFNVLISKDLTTEKKLEIFDSFYQGTEENDVLNKKMFHEFMDILCEIIKADAENTVEKNVMFFMEILKISGTTASVVNTSFATNGKESKAIRYQNDYEQEFKYHLISEQLEKFNKPSGWNGCKINKMVIFGKEVEISTFVDIVVYTIKELYEKDRDKFMRIYNDCDNNGLYGLFKGSRKKDGIVSRKEVYDIIFEAKNSNDQKIQYLRKLFNLMDYDSSELKLNIKLAIRRQL